MSPPVLETLKGLDLIALAEHEHVLALDGTVHQLDTPAVVLVGTPTPDGIAHLVAANPQTAVGVLVPLPRGRDGTPRAAASGAFSAAARDAIAASGAVFLGDEVTAAPAFKVVEMGMWAANGMIARETYDLARKNGVDLGLLFDALANGAAGSQAFRDLWPELLAGHATAADDMIARAHRALSAALALASSHVFYAPLMGLAKQQALAPICELHKHVPTTHAPKEITPEDPAKVGFIGLGAMGRPMSLVLHKAGLNVSGYDVWDGARDAYAHAGGRVATSIADCATDADVLVLIVVNAAQVEDILFAQGALTLLAPDAAVLVMSTIPASAARRLGERIASIRSDVSLIDCPVSGATPRAATGDLMVFCGGLDDADPRARAHAYRVLRLLSSSQGNEHYLVRVPGGVGRGCAVKLSNQHLAGTHISNCAETLAFTAKLGMSPRAAHKLLMNGPGWCWVLGHRGVSMLDGLIQPPTSAIDIFVKDMGIVVAEADVLRVPVPLAALVQQQFVFAKSLGWGKDDDSGLVRVWQYAGVVVDQK